MELSVIIPHIEALIFASEKPLAVNDLVELVNNSLGFIEDRASAEQVEAAINAINEKYASEFYSFEMVESGGGWQFLTKKEYHKTIAQLNGDKFLKKLSVAAIETLSIIAYKQPVTKSEIEVIRGVNCDYAVQKLLEKDLIIISGRKEDAVGKPLIYATSKSFMDYFGINSPEDLPKIREILNQEIIEATKIEREENIEDLIPADDEINNVVIIEKEINTDTIIDFIETENVTDEEKGDIEDGISV
ncbi:MAG: SMC-Scp complex subunit ScpB [Bacteroidota bacterium]|jgi:segregation and condensation protein B|nr:SMC-Scp complex subunit ScpB [Bacteroidota bacterium]